MKKSTIGLIVGLIIVVFGASMAYNALQNKDLAQNKQQSEEGLEVKPDGPVTETPNQSRAKAPDFTVFDGEGKQVKFSDLGGKPTVINFWASWCSFCKIEMPDFQEVYDKYKGQNIEFMMIAGTDGKRETRETADSFLKENTYNLPVYYDEALFNRDGLDVLDSANAAYMISGYPSTVFVDSDGNVAGIYSGALDQARLTKLVEFIMDENNNQKSMDEALK